MDGWCLRVHVSFLDEVLVLDFFGRFVQAVPGTDLTSVAAAVMFESVQADFQLEEQ